MTAYMALAHLRGEALPSGEALAKARGWTVRHDDES